MAVRIFGIEDLNDAVGSAAGPTDDDVSVTTDGRRLDTKEKVLEFLAELQAERDAAGE